MTIYLHASPPCANRHCRLEQRNHISVARIEQALQRPLSQFFLPWSNCLPDSFQLSVGTLSKIEYVIELASHLRPEEICLRLGKAVNEHRDGEEIPTSTHSKLRLSQKRIEKHFKALSIDLKAIVTKASSTNFSSPAQLHHHRLQHTRTTPLNSSTIIPASYRSHSYSPRTTPLLEKEEDTASSRSKSSQHTSPADVELAGSPKEGLEGPECHSESDV